MTPEPLIIDLERFDDRCSCGERIDALYQGPAAYGVVHLTTARGEVVAIDGLHSPDWRALVTLVDAEAGRRGFDRDRRDKLLRAAVERAIAPAASGLPWGLWGTVPCPRCGERTRVQSVRRPGPAVPHAALPAAFAAWNAVAPEVRAARVAAWAGELGESR